MDLEHEDDENDHTEDPGFKVEDKLIRGNPESGSLVDILRRVVSYALQYLFITIH